MKILKIALLLVFSSFVSLYTKAQKIKITDGNLSVLKDEKSINTEFTYDHMKVGKFDREEDYVASKKEEYNKQEPGKGDTWAKAWVDDRIYKYESKFTGLFEKYCEISNKKDSKYTLIIHTVFTEPGFYAGIVKKNAEISLEVWLVETSNRSNVVAKMTVDKVPGRSWSSYDTGERISECYADAGKAVGKFVRDKAK